MALNKVKFVFEASCGANLYDCQVEAVILAMQHRADIEFTHNDRIYTVEFKKLVDEVDRTVRIKVPQ